jgi:hypothetical protein
VLFGVGEATDMDRLFHAQQDSTFPNTLPEIALGGTSLKLTYDHERHLVLMRVVKTAREPGEQEEVIRQIPPEELLEFAKRLEKSQGVLFDRQV